MFGCPTPASTSPAAVPHGDRCSAALPPARTRHTRRDRAVPSPNRRRRRPAANPAPRRGAPARSRMGSIPAGRRHAPAGRAPSSRSRDRPGRPDPPGPTGHGERSRPSRPACAPRSRRRPGSAPATRAAHPLESAGQHERSLERPGSRASAAGTNDAATSTSATSCRVTTGSTSRRGTSWGSSAAALRRLLRVEPIRPLRRPCRRRRQSRSASVLSRAISGPTQVTAFCQSGDLSGAPGRCRARRPRGSLSPDGRRRTPRRSR